MADLTEEQIDMWDAFFSKATTQEQLARPLGCYALTDMARKYLRARKEFILLRVYRPEGYEDVAPQLVLEDFLRSAAVGWTVELVKQHEGDTATNAAKEEGK